MIKARIRLRLSERGVWRGMVRLEGFEPPANRFEVCRSIQLSYRRVRNYEKWNIRTLDRIMSIVHCSTVQCSNALIFYRRQKIWGE